jgi:hypothetical protein
LKNGQWSDPQSLSKDGWEIRGCPVNGPAISSAGQNVAVAWFTAARDQPRVDATPSADGGATFGPPILVGDENPIGRVDVIALSSGNALVSWANEIPTSLVDHFEFYLLNYFKPATYQQTSFTREGRRLFGEAGCAVCHVPDLMITRDRRVADVETAYDEEKGIFNRLFATAKPLFTLFDDGRGLPPLRTPAYRPFLVKNIFTDFKRHDLGANFYERNYDGTLRTQFMTLPLWGVGGAAPYGHDGRSINLMEVILRHGGEARESRDEFARLSRYNQMALIEFLNSLVIFPPDDTASNLDPGNRGAMRFPQFGHGSIKLAVLFNDPTDIE